MVGAVDRLRSKHFLSHWIGRSMFAAQLTPAAINDAGLGFGG
jgi:hypothetical protein